MVVGVDAVAVAAKQRRAGAARPSRRELTRWLPALAAALGLTPVVAASRPAPPVRSEGTSFDETYRGRRIKGVPVAAAGRRAAECEWRITVDGRPLHLMRRADGSWLSMVDHYTSYRTPLEATRAAVDEIGPGLRLRDPAPEHMGDGHTGDMGQARGGTDAVRA
ncbi:tyrosinase family oxidase copper chaperone [Streptomyces sp. NPDC048191]|uniref:tyrosinase family oxidase copper chaperone n=1 Tax=Streptomyces sp. NPDC048191 TaxID=3155484 RepID=UPI0033D35905